MDSRFRGNDVIRVRYVTLTTTVIPAEAGIHDGRRIPKLELEVKRTSAPRVTRSMRTALEDLPLDRVDVIHAGSETFPLGQRIRAVAASRVPDDLRRTPVLGVGDGCARRKVCNDRREDPRMRR